MSQTLKIKTLFQDNQVIMFRHPQYGRVKARILNTEYLAQSGWTVSLIVSSEAINNDSGTLSSVLYINERFLNKLIEKAS